MDPAHRRFQKFRASLLGLIGLTLLLGLLSLAFQISQPSADLLTFGPAGVSFSDALLYLGQRLSDNLKFFWQSLWQSW